MGMVAVHSGGRGWSGLTRWAGMGSMGLGLGLGNTGPYYRTVEQCSPMDSACVNRNLAVQANNMAVADYNRAMDNYRTALVNWERNMSFGFDTGRPIEPTWAEYAARVDGIYYNPPTGQVHNYVVGTETPGTYVQSNPVAVGAGPRLVFRNLTTGNPAVLRIGDRWSISIEGAVPNAKVALFGGKDGVHSGMDFGSTDASGRWYLEGAASEGELGSWYEKWTVGGQSLSGGEFRFDVVPAGTSTGGGTEGGGNSNVVNVTVAPTPEGGEIYTPGGGGVVNVTTAPPAGILTSAPTSGGAPQPQPSSGDSWAASMPMLAIAGLGLLLLARR